MLTADEKAKLERGFTEGETSQRLEGIEPGEPYWNMKARVLAGEITLEQGIEEILAFHKAKTFAVA